MPMKYRKRPTLVDAVQFKATDPLPDGVDYDRNGNAIVFTPTGEMRVREGDWVIRNILGEYFTCSREMFENLYEPA